MVKTKLLIVLMLTALVMSAKAQTTFIKGLTVIVEYTGAPFTVSTDSVSMLMNQPGFSGWGNYGSVRDYYLAQSAGKLDLSTTTIKISLPHTRSYYENGGGGDISDMVDQINSVYPAGFQNLTIDPDGAVKHFNIITRAGGGSWAFGEQGGSQIIKNNGQNVKILRGNFSNYAPTQFPYINTICHETGHSTFNWGDYYNTAWSNLGRYSIMGNGGPEGAPMGLSPALRLEKNWIGNVIEIGAATQTYTATSNSYTTVYKYTNPSNSQEFLLIAPHVYDNAYYRQRIGTGNVPDQGLAIYYVDKDGAMDITGTEPGYYVSIVTASNVDEFHDEARANIDIFGNLNDFFDNNTNTFNSSTSIFKWKNGGDFGLSITNISAPGATMTFTVNARPNTFIATADKNGTISPVGVLSAANGTSKTFTFSPYPGYRINQLKVNDVVTAVSGNSYTTTAGGTKTIAISYVRKAVQDALPLPWKTADIGTATTAGVAGQAANTYYLESYGDDIDGTSDNFRFVYQTMKGDGSILVRLAFANKPRKDSKAGIMIRESLAANAAYSMLLFAPREETRVQQRNATGGNTIDNPNGYGNLHVYNLYKWYRITRTGNKIVSECSRDLSEWVKLGDQTIAMNSLVYIGMAVSGGLPTYPSRAQFDNITVTKTNLAPVISVTAPLSVNNIAPKYLVAGSQKVSANVTDDALDKVVFTLTKTGATYVDVTAPYEYTFTNLPAPYGDGSLSYTIVATDNDGVSTTSNVIVYKNRVPSVILTAPSNNATVSAGNVTLSALVNDADWTGGKVEYFRGTTKIGETSRNTAGTPAINYTWAAVAGTYSITAKATDDMGEFATSSAISVTVTGSACSSPQWLAVTAYNSGAIVQRNGMKYIANWWTQGNDPAIYSGPSGSGQPWTSQGTCNSRMELEAATEAAAVVYPNPTAGVFTIDTESDATAQVLNTFGEEVAAIALSKGKNEVNLSVAAGIYFVKINSNVIKLVIE